MAKEGKYNLFYKDFDSVRHIIRSAFLYGGYSKADYCALTGISARKYEDCLRFMREVFGDNYAYVNEGKEKYARLNYKAFETATNPLARSAAFMGFTYNDFNCYFHVLDLLTDHPEGMPIERLLDELCSRGMVCDRGTVRKSLETMVTDGYLLKEQKGRQVFYNKSNDLSKELNKQELEQVADYLSLVKDINKYKIPLYSLSQKLPESDFCCNIKIGGYYPAQVLDEEVRFALERAKNEKRVVSFDYINAQSEILSIESAIPVKLFDGDYGRQYVFCFVNFNMQCGVFRLDRISNLSPTETIVEAEFDNSYLEYVWCVSIAQTCKVNNIQINFDFGKDKNLPNRLIRNKKFGKVEKISDGKYLFSITIKDYIEMVPMLRTFYAYITKINNENLKNKLQDDLKKLGDAYGIN